MTTAKLYARNKLNYSNDWICQIVGKKTTRKRKIPVQWLPAFSLFFQIVL